MTTQSIMVDEVYPSRFLHGVDIPGAGWLVTVSDVNLEDLDDFNGGKQAKIVLSLVEIDKDIALNRTQSRALQDYFGPDATQWVGQKVAISPEKLKNGQTTIRFVRGQPQAPAKPKVTVAVPKPPEMPPTDIYETAPPPEALQE
jgi:hypothetical protein